MLGHEFMRNAFLAGSFVALACGLVGYFVVLRAQVFAGDALSHVAFTGALAAAAAGIDLRIGLFAVTILVALGMGAAGERARADDAVVGSFFAWILGLGALFLSIFTTSSSGSGDGTAGVRVLFGSIFGLSAGEARLAAALGALAIVILLALARPLLFSSVDAEVAEARGLKVKLIGLAFLGVLGLVAAEATQAVGALLLLGLLAAPAGAAYRLTSNPYAGLALSGAIAVGSMWIGLVLSYEIHPLPPSSAIAFVAVAAHVAALIATRDPREGRQPSLESVT
jgi:zinc/manganese transport system permease protein